MSGDFSSFSFQNLVINDASVDEVSLRFQVVLRSSDDRSFGRFPLFRLRNFEVSLRLQVVFGFRLLWSFAWRPLWFFRSLEVTFGFQIVLRLLRLWSVARLPFFWRALLKVSYCTILYIKSVNSPDI